MFTGCCCCYSQVQQFNVTHLQGEQDVPWLCFWPVSIWSDAPSHVMLTELAFELWPVLEPPQPWKTRPFSQVHFCLDPTYIMLFTSCSAEQSPPMLSSDSQHSYCSSIAPTDPQLILWSTVPCPVFLWSSVSLQTRLFSIVEGGVATVPRRQNRGRDGSVPETG